jgi:hypothetical protein
MNNITEICDLKTVDGVALRKMKELVISLKSGQIVDEYHYAIECKCFEYHRKKNLCKNIVANQTFSIFVVINVNFRF